MIRLRPAAWAIGAALALSLTVWALLVAAIVAAT